jgi:hypothetical protein
MSMPQFPQPQPAPRKKRHVLAWVLGSIGGVFALLLITGIIGASLSGGGTAPVGATTAVQTVTVTAPAVTVTKTVAASPAPTVTVTKTVAAAPAPTVTVTQTVTADAAPPAAPAAPPAPAVIYEKSGSGITTTPNFTTPAEWQIQWSYDCSKFGTTGNFIVMSEDFQANVNQLGAGGTDATYVHGDPGTHSLQINSECSWTVKVVG